MQIVSIEDNLYELSNLVSLKKKKKKKKKERVALYFSFQLTD